MNRDNFVNSQDPTVKSGPRVRVYTVPRGRLVRQLYSADWPNIGGLVLGCIEADFASIH